MKQKSIAEESQSTLKKMKEVRSQSFFSSIAFYILIASNAVVVFVVIDRNLISPVTVALWVTLDLIMVVYWMFTFNDFYYDQTKFGYTNTYFSSVGTEVLIKDIRSIEIIGDRGGPNIRLHLKYFDLVCVAHRISGDDLQKMVDEINAIIQTSKKK